MTQIDLIKNDYFYKTRNIKKVPGLDNQTKLWEELFTKIRINTRIPFELFYQYAWYFYKPEHVEEYFGNDANLYELFQETFPSVSDGKKIIKFMNELTKIADSFIKLDNPNSGDWCTDDWNIYFEKLLFIKKISKSLVTDQYSLILLPLYYQYENTQNRKYKKALKKSISLMADTVLIYYLISRFDEKEQNILIDIENFFSDVSRELLRFSFNPEYNNFDDILKELEAKRTFIISNVYSLLSTIISELKYSKHNYIEDFDIVRYLLKRVNELNGNSIHAVKGSVEHIVEDENRDEQSSSIGNLVYLELIYNEEASISKQKTEYNSQEFINYKFNEIYSKSSYFEVQKLIQNYNPIDVNSKMVEERSIEITKNYLDNFIKLENNT